MVFLNKFRVNSLGIFRETFTLPRRQPISWDGWMMRRMNIGRIIERKRRVVLNPSKDFYSLVNICRLFTSILMCECERREEGRRVG
jgi:hypothetical protein